MNKTELVAALIKHEEIMQELEKVEEGVKAVKTFEEEIVAEVQGEWVSEACEGLIEVEKKSKRDYIEEIQIDTIVAFKIATKTISGKVKEIHKFSLLIETKNGICYTISKGAVIWVKKANKWPDFIYKALKGQVQHEQYTECRNRA